MEMVLTAPIQNLSHKSLSFLHVRVDGDWGACLQQDIPWRGWLRGDVLRPGLRHVPGQPHHQVRVQVPLVLRRALPRLPPASGRAHLQGPDVTWTTGFVLALASLTVFHSSWLVSAHFTAFSKNHLCQTLTPAKRSAQEVEVF